jgi:O-antigen/teichoic acid export membrane protein
LRQECLYVGLAFVALAYTETGRTALITAGRAGLAGLIVVAPSALFLLFAVIVSAHPPAGHLAAEAFALSQLAGLALAGLAVHGVIGRPRLPSRLPVGTLSQAVPLALIWFLSDVHLRVDATMLFYMRGSAETGLYGAAHRLIEGLMSVCLVVSATALPHLAREWASGRAEWKQAWKLAAGLLSALVLAPILLLVLGPGFLMRALYGHSYIPAAPILAVLGVAGYCLCMGALVAVGLTSIGKERLQLGLTALAVALNVGANWALIPVFGGLGAALATLISSVAFLTVAGVALHRHSGDRRRLESHRPHAMQAPAHDPGKVPQSPA